MNKGPSNMDIVQGKIEYISFEQLIFSIETLLNTKYHEVEEHREELNLLDVVHLATSSLLRDVVKSTGPYNRRINYKIEKEVLMKLSNYISLWEDMLNVFLQNVTNENISKDSQHQCCLALIDMLKFSLINSRQFLITIGRFKYILNVLHGRQDPKNEVTLGKEVTELMNELREKLGTHEADKSMEQIVHYWDINRVAKKLFEAMESEYLHEEVLENLFNICFQSWRELVVSVDETSRDRKNIESFQIRNKLVIISNSSNNVIESIEKMFQIIFFAVNPEFSDSIHQILDSAFKLMQEMKVRVKNKSSIPNSILKFILSSLTADFTHSIQRDILQFLQQIPVGVAELLSISNSCRDQFQEMIDLILLYGTRCLERDVPISSALNQLIIDSTLGTLDYSIARDSLELVVTHLRSVLSSPMEEIFQAIKDFANSFYHSSIKSKRKSIRLLIRFSREIILVGDDPIEVLKSVLAFVSNNGLHDELFTSQNVTYSINCLIERLRTNLVDNCISIQDILHVMIPSISQLMSEQGRTISHLNKVRLIIDCSSILIKNIRSIHDFRMLLDYALSLIDFTLPREGGVKQINLFFRKISVRFLISRSAYLFQFAQASVERLTSHSPKESLSIKALFYHLLTEGSLAKISFIYLACQKYVFDNELVAPLHTILYNKAYPLEIFGMFSDITTALCFIHENEFGNSSQNKCLEPFEYLIKNLVREIFEKINSEDMSQNCWQDLYDKAMLSVFFSLAIREESLLDESSVDKHDLYLLLNDCTPLVLRQLIISITKRIIYMHMGMYSPLKRNVIQLLLRAIYRNNNVLDPTVTATHPARAIDNGNKVLENIQHCISEDAFNRKTVESLVKSGYSRDISRYNIQLQVQVSKRKSAALGKVDKYTPSQYKEYEYLLKSFYVSALWFSHSKVLVCDLFKGELSPQQIEARLRYTKMHLLRWINKRYIPAYHLKAVQILENERNSLTVVSTANTQRNKDRNRLTITLLTQFPETLLSCSDTVLHSFLEFGAHNEVPLEIAIRQDRALVSIRNSHSNEEIETCQIIFMREGVYVMESTAKRTGVATTSAWCQLFTKLLTTERLVPSIILPRGHPNTDTWSYLNEMVQTECFSSHLTWSPFYSYEWVTHYTNVPKKIHAMNDIVLHPGFRDSKGMCQSMTPVWCAQIDIVGVVLAQVFKQLSKTYLSSVYCRYSEYIHSLVSGHLVPNDNINVPIDPPNRYFPAFLGEDAMRAVDNWILSTNLDELFVSNRKIFLDLKGFLDRYSNEKKYKHVRAEIKRIIADSFHFFIISDLPIEIQKASMLWIEQIDDSLWNEIERFEDPFRYLLKRTEPGVKLFPGFVCFFLPEYKQTRSIPMAIHVLSPDKLCGYIVGKVSQFPEFNPNGTKEDLFDVWGTWIDPKFRKLGIAINFYRYALRLFPTKYLELEMKDGFDLKCAGIVGTGCFLTWFGIIDFIMNRLIVKEGTSKWNFYLAADERKFKRYIFDLKALRPFVYIDTAVSYCSKKWSRIRVKTTESSYIRLIGLVFILFTMLTAIL